MVRGDVRDLEFLNDSWLEDVDFDGTLRFLLSFGLSELFL